MIKAFPKIFHIGKDYISDIFDGEVEVTEKVDGSQFIFGKIDGQLYTRSKGTMQRVESHDKMFDKAIDQVVSIKHKIPDNTVFYCEYLQRPKHNTLKYEKTPKNYLALFGVCSSSEKFISKYDELKKYAKLLDIDVVPLIYKGKIENTKEVKNMLERQSYLGGAKIEGVVVKNYNKPFLLGGQPIPVMAGKYVSEEFKEVHRKNWSKNNTGPGKFQKLQESYKTTARWNKAIQHLQEKGELEHAPRDIGKLLNEIKEDIIEECKEEIKEQLWKIFSRDILRTATKGFPQYYKEKLLDDSFKTKE